MESKFADLNGLRLNYGEGPANGPRLVFLPGFPCPWTGYRPLLDALVPNYHVFALSFRGQGLSDRAPPYAISSYIEDTAAFLREVAGPGALGVAHSAGSWFGLAAAGENADLFRAFVSVDQPLDPGDHLRFHGTDTTGVEALRAAMRAARDAGDLAERLAGLPGAQAANPDDRRRRAELLIGVDPETFTPWIEGIGDWLMVPELQAWPGRYRAPLLFLDGDPQAGSMLSARAVEYNLSRYPWAGRVEVAGADHIMGLRSDPARALAEIGRFLEGLH